MLSTSREAKDLLGSDLDAAYFFVLRGRPAILRIQPVLMRLSALCEQTGAMDYLEYFLTGISNLKKIPYLVLVGKRRDLSVAELRAEDLKGAVLVYEYKVLGMQSRVFTTSDFNGGRAVIAMPAERTRISASVGRYLMTNGAQVVMLSYAGEGDETWSECFGGSVAGDKKRLWTTQTREVGATIVLRHAFLSEKAVDIVVAKRSLFVSLLRRVAHWPPPGNNFLLQTLVDPALRWELH